MISLLRSEYAMPCTILDNDVGVKAHMCMKNQGARDEILPNTGSYENSNYKIFIMLVPCF